MKGKLLEQSKTEEENKQKIQILENLINQKTNNQRRLEDERNQYEKMIMEQQKIISKVRWIVKNRITGGNEES